MLEQPTESEATPVAEEGNSAPTEAHSDGANAIEATVAPTDADHAAVHTALDAEDATTDAAATPTPPPSMEPPSTGDDVPTLDGGAEDAQPLPTAGDESAVSSAPEVQAVDVGDAPSPPPASQDGGGEPYSEQAAAVNATASEQPAQPPSPAADTQGDLDAPDPAIAVDAATPTNDPDDGGATHGATVPAEVLLDPLPTSPQPSSTNISDAVVSQCLGGDCSELVELVVAGDNNTAMVPSASPEATATGVPASDGATIPQHVASMGTSAFKVIMDAGMCTAVLVLCFESHVPSRVLCVCVCGQHQ